MKKRSDAANCDDDKKGNSGENYSVFGYIAVLFAATLLLLLLSWFIDQRNEESDLSQTKTEQINMLTESQFTSQKHSMNIYYL